MVGTIGASGQLYETPQGVAARLKLDSRGASGWNTTKRPRNLSHPLPLATIPCRHWLACGHELCHRPSGFHGMADQCEEQWTIIIDSLPVLGCRPGRCADKDTKRFACRDLRENSCHMATQAPRSSNFPRTGPLTCAIHSSSIALSVIADNNRASCHNHRCCRRASPTRHCRPHRSRSLFA